MESLGGEGLMLRQPESLYVAGRSATLLKVKSFKDDEAVVIGHQAGDGAAQGAAGGAAGAAGGWDGVCDRDGVFGQGTGGAAGGGGTVVFRYQELPTAACRGFRRFSGVRAKNSLIDQLLEPDRGSIWPDTGLLGSESPT